MLDLLFIDKELELLSNSNLKRDLKTVLSAPGPWVEISGDKRVLQLCSNNYLGLANHPEIINASKAAATKFGTGSTGSRLLSGTTELHSELEKAIAHFEGTEDAIFFSCGYSTNIGVLSSLIGKNDIVYSDQLNHASIIDGIRLSETTKMIYNHCDISHLELLIKENSGKYRRSFIVTDTVFSMDGDIAPLVDIARISEQYNCIPIIDEAHATGIFGRNSRGIAEEMNLESSFPIRIGTCSKAIGVEGGFCTGPKNLIDLLKNKARSFMFSTSSSPPVAGAILKSFELITDSSWRKEKLWQNVQTLYDGLKKNYKLKLNNLTSPIIPVYFTSIDEALTISEKLFTECNIWAPAIRPPSVETPLIRLTPISTHSEDDMNYIIKAFDYVSKDLKIEPQWTNCKL